MFNPFDLFDLISNPRLRWAVLAGVLGVLDLLLFIGCLQAENTRCTAITGVLGVAILVFGAWHGLIYAAQRKGGF